MIGRLLGVVLLVCVSQPLLLQVAEGQAATREYREGERPPFPESLSGEEDRDERGENGLLSPGQTVDVIERVEEPGSLEDGIEYRGQRVRTDRLIAKKKAGVAAQSAVTTLASEGYAVVGQLTNVPGVMVVHSREASASVASGQQSSAEQAQALDEKIQRLMETGQFAYVEPDWIVQVDAVPTDQFYVEDLLWGLNNVEFWSSSDPEADIDAPAAWDITTGSRDVIVGVIDTGIRYTHQDLVGNMWQNPDETPGDGIDDDGNGYIDDVYGINAITGSGDPMDDNNHGTHVAGTIGATANDGGGHVGVAWDVQLMGLKFLGANGSGATSDSLFCIDYGLSKGVDVFSASWGGGGFSQALEDTLEAANQAGVLFVASAGNNWRNTDLSPHYPSSYENDNVLSVTAIEPDGDRRYNFGKESVDVAAPGYSILSSVATGDADYEYFSGTSMATPHVTGLAALILSVYPDAKIEELRSRIEGTVTVTEQLFAETSSGGWINAPLALSEPDGTMELDFIVSHSVMPSGGEVAVHVFVRDAFSVLDASVMGSLRLPEASGGVAASAVAFSDDGVAPDLAAGDGVYAGRLLVPVGVESVTLTVEVTAPGKDPATHASDYEAREVPANDDFANRIMLDPGLSSTTGSIENATTELFENTDSGRFYKSIWWSWKAVDTGWVEFDTFGSEDPNYLRVFLGDELSKLNLFASGFPNVAPGSRVGFLAEQGEIYQVQVSGWEWVAGEIVLNYPQTLDLTGPATVVISPDTFSSYEGDRVQLGVVAGGEPELTYRWSKNGDPLPDATGATLNFESVSLADAGTYSVEVSNSFGSASSVTVTSSVLAVAEQGQAPVNDHFADSIELMGERGVARGNNTLASREAGESSPGAAGLWWHWRAPADGQVSLTTRGSAVSAIIGIFTGDDVGDLSLVQAIDYDSVRYYAPVTFLAREGITYRISLASHYSDEWGDLVIGYEFIPITGSIVNGSFETGDSFGWRRNEDESHYSFERGQRSKSWSWGDLQFRPMPTEGKFSALLFLDGYSPFVDELSQLVRIEDPGMELVFDYQSAWGFWEDGSATVPKSFSVVVEPMALGGIPGAASGPVEFPIMDTGLGTSDGTGVVPVRLPLDEFAGQVVDITFRWDVPEERVGPVFFEIDNIRLEPESSEQNLSPAYGSIYSSDNDFLGEHFSSNSGLDRIIRVGGDIYSEGDYWENRAVAEFVVLEEEIHTASVHFNLPDIEGIYSNEPSPETDLLVEVYAGDNIVEVTDFEMPVLEVVRRIPSSELFAGGPFTVDVTDAYNQLIRDGVPSLGVKLRWGSIEDYVRVHLTGFTLEVDGNVQIAFADANLEAGLREALGIADGPVTKNDIRSITSLALPGREIADLSGLEWAPRLERVSLPGNLISDLSPIAGAVGLRSLDVSDNDISDLSLLSGFPGLRTLRLSRNGIDDIAPLGDLPGLASVYLDGNLISDLDPLRALNRLSVLFLSDNLIDDLGPLATLDLLAVLDVSRNAIDNVTPLAGLFDLSILNLSRNQIEDASPLDGLGNLIQLNLSHNLLSDADALAGMFNLQTLSLANNELRDITGLGGLSAFRDGTGPAVMLQNNRLRVGPMSPQRSVVDTLRALDDVTVVFWPQVRIDEDGDEMDDRFEQRIIDDNPTDDLVTIEDVLPGDDYDNDNSSNLREFRRFTSPTDPTSRLRMGDIDRDGLVSILDLVRLRKHLNGQGRGLLPEEYVMADMDSDGELGGSDGSMLADQILVDTQE